MLFRSHDGFELGVIGSIYPSGTTRLIFPGAYRTDERIPQEVTPRFDLPRAWTPTGEPVPGEWEESASTPSIRRWCARWEQKPDEETP